MTVQSETSVRNASITAGGGLLLMAALSGFGNFVAVVGLVTQRDTEQTARDITASESLFRFGILSLSLVIALDVVVALALYRVFSPVSKSISMLAAALRLVYAGVFMVAIGYLAHRSGYVARFLGILLAIAGLGYVTDTFGVVLSQGTWTDVSSFTFIGEFLLALWLLIWGRRLTLERIGAHDEDPAALSGVR